MMPFKTAHYFPTWPAMTNRLRNERYMPRSGRSTRGCMPCLSARRGPFLAAQSKNVFHSIDMPTGPNFCRFNGQCEVHPHIPCTSPWPATMQSNASPITCHCIYATDPYRSP